MGMLERVRRATQVLISPLDVVRTTVRPQDTRVVSPFSRDVTDSERALQYNGWVKIATDMTAQAVASRPLKVFRRKPSMRGKGAWDVRDVSRKDRTRYKNGPRSCMQKFADLHDDIEEITDPAHPLVRILEQFNPWSDGFDATEQMDSHLSLFGNAFWVKAWGDAPYPIELWGIHPIYTAIVPHEKQFIQGYLYGREPTPDHTIFFDESAVIHFSQKRGVSPDPFRGIGNLDAVMLEADLSRLISVHQYATLEQGASPGLMVTGKGVTSTNRAEIAAILDQEHGGAEGAGRSMVFAGELTVEQVAELSKELSYLQSNKEIRDKIAAAFQIPVSLITVEDVNRSNGEVAALHWHITSIGPRLRRMDDKLNEKLVPDFEDALGQQFVVMHEEPDLEGAGVAAAAMREDWKAGLRFRDEVRTELDLEGVDDGEQVYFSETLPKVDPAGAGGGLFGLTLSGTELNCAPRHSNDGARHSNVSRDDESLKRSLEDANAGRTRDIDDVFKDLFSEHAHDHTDKWPEFKRIEDADQIVANERQLTASLRRWFASLTGDVNTETGVFTLSGDPSLPAEVNAQLDKLFLEGMQAAARELGTVEPTELTAQARAVIDRNSQNLVESLSRSVNERLSRTLQDSIEAGESISETTLRVEEVIGRDSTSAAAERIARTETSNAFVEGRLEQYKGDDEVVGKEWLLSSNPCPVCIGIHKQSKIVAKGANFTGPDGTTVQRPPAHPQCRCDIRAVRRD